MTAAEVVLANDGAALEAMDPAAREAAVTQYLSHAREQLAAAVQMTGPAAVAAVKAEIATAAEATKQLGLSKDIQMDAQEMVRRAEYALGKAIRAGQEAGDIRKQGETITKYDRWNGRLHETKSSTKAAATDYASQNELSGADGDGIYALADGVSGSEFDAALADAKDEGNLSRANVVRKVRGVKSEGLTPVERLRKIRDLAPRGMTSQQIGREVGITEDRVRFVARENGIDIPADRIMRGTRRLDHTRFVAKTVEQLDALASGLDVLDPAQVDWSEHDDWVTSLTDSMRALNRFVNTVRKGPND